jgi:hypothetical protein
MDEQFKDQISSKNRFVNFNELVSFLFATSHSTCLCLFIYISDKTSKSFIALCFCLICVSIGPPCELFSYKFFPSVSISLLRYIYISIRIYCLPLLIYSTSLVISFHCLWASCVLFLLIFLPYVPLFISLFLLSSIRFPSLCLVTLSTYHVKSLTLFWSQYCQYLAQGSQTQDLPVHLMLSSRWSCLSYKCGPAQWQRTF